jgi:hypothetical protein
VDVDTAYWDAYLARRGRFIRRVADMVRQSDLTADEELRRLTALKASLGRLALITSQFCVDYIQAWFADWEQWQRHLQRLEVQRDRAAALAMLSAKGSARLSWQLGGEAGRAVLAPADPAQAVAAMLPRQATGPADWSADHQRRADQSGTPGR